MMGPLLQVKIIQAFWGRIINRSKIPHLLRCIPRNAQILCGFKLGWKSTMSLHSPDAAYVLNLKKADDNYVGHTLFRAGADIRGRCVNNLMVDGARL